MKGRWILVIVALAAGGVAGAVQVRSQAQRGAAESVAVASAVQHPVVINRPDGTPGVETGEIDHLGRPVTAACSTCHAALEPANHNDSANLVEFHLGLVVEHGDLGCLACHNPDDYDTLRRADGRAVRYADVMTLCAQCHGTQASDYDRGTHGGMSGHWDLSRGPRFRNGCTDCHDPHAPAFPRMLPTFKPRDRFLGPGTAGERGHE